LGIKDGPGSVINCLLVIGQAVFVEIITEVKYRCFFIKGNEIPDGVYYRVFAIGQLPGIGDQHDPLYNTILMCLPFGKCIFLGEKRKLEQ